MATMIQDEIARLQCENQELGGDIRSMRLSRQGVCEALIWELHPTVMTKEELFAALENPVPSEKFNEQLHVWIRQAEEAAKAK